MSLRTRLLLPLPPRLPTSAHRDPSCVLAAPPPMPMSRPSTALTAPAASSSTSTATMLCGIQPSTCSTPSPPPTPPSYQSSPKSPSYSLRPTTPASPTSATKPGATTQASRSAPSNLSPTFAPVWINPGRLRFQHLHQPSIHRCDSQQSPRQPYPPNCWRLLGPTNPDREQTSSVSGRPRDLAADPDHLAIFLVEATGRLADPAMMKLLKCIVQDSPNRSIINHLCTQIGVQWPPMRGCSTISALPTFRWGSWRGNSASRMLVCIQYMIFVYNKP